MHEKASMRKKASILMISSWVLSLLVIFALSLGYRAQIALKLSRYQTDSFSADCLLAAGINRAIAELKKDTNSYDSLVESWSDNEEVFAKISPEGSEKQFCSISYENNQGKKFGISDEESKLNLNNCGLRAVEELFSAKGLSLDAKEFSQVLWQWISRAEKTEEEKKVFKNSTLSVKEELLLVLEYFYKDKPAAHKAYESLEGSITVYGDGKLNINTVSEETLSILCAAYAKGVDDPGAAKNLAQKLIKLRQEQEQGFFKDITSIAFSAGLQASELSLWNKVSAFLDVKSNYFNIKAQAVTKGTFKEANAVFNRKTNEIVYWHQY